MPIAANITTYEDVNGIIHIRIAISKKVTTIVETGRPIRSEAQAPNGSAGMINQLARLTIAPAEVRVMPFVTRNSGPKLSGKMNAIL
jgi:hypothetical protein